MNEFDFKEQLEIKITKLSQNIWEDKVGGISLNKWLENFQTNDDPSKCEQTHALYLVSNFMYFGTREIRELLKSLYRDKFLKPLVQTIRRQNQDTKLLRDIQSSIKKDLSETRFLGIGNPSESGTHLLYFFRQENNLSKDDFLHSHEIISMARSPVNQQVTLRLKNSKIRRYIFLDDVCGSGTQAIEYSKTLLSEIKALDPTIKICYFSLFSTAHGMKNIRKNTHFDEVGCIFELDESFKCFSDEARQFKGEAELPISKDFAKAFCEKYGINLLNSQEHALGYKSSQLLLGFAHNTPDNTLPIIWGETATWTPLFKRYQKY
ncbi:hypothetical protein [Colwellia psychrerythraea]|nr:hypothetical protein [Colwellia psychrerythraea]